MRVGIVVDSLDVPAWVRHMCDLLIATEVIELRIYYGGTSSSTRRPSRNTVPEAMWNSYAHLDRLAFGRRKANAFGRVSFAGNSLATPLSRQLDSGDADLEAMRGDALDIVICSSENAKIREFSQVTRFGAWYLRHAGETSGKPAFFTQLNLNEPVCRSELVGREPNATCERVLLRAYTATNPESWHRTRNSAYWQTAAFPARMLRALHAEGWKTVEGATADEQAATATPETIATAPSSLSLAEAVTCISRVAWRVLWRKLSSRFFHEQWAVKYRRRQGDERLLALEEFCDVPSPRRSSYADPFLIDRDGQHFLFVEDLSEQQKHGRISVFRLPSDHSLTNPEIALERETHLSYPHVFAVSGQIYMVPATASERRVVLYRSVEFPHRWEEHKTLLSDIAARDATLFQDGTRYWLFVSVTEFGARNGEELSLFMAESLEGPWRPHPRNPIVSDTRRARPAGALFWRSGELFRPSQDLSRRYGGALVLNRVTRLSEHEYSEIPVERIEPDGDGLVGIHHYNATEAFEVIDVCRRVSRLNVRLWSHGRGGQRHRPPGSHTSGLRRTELM